jgi:hypothetical protein
VRKGILLALLMVSGTAQAADWRSVGTEKGVEYLVDISDVYVKGPIRRVWVKDVDHRPLSERGELEPGKKLFDLSREFFDCANETVRLETMLSRYNDGTDSKPFTFPPNDKVVVPDTIEFALLKFVCGLRMK